MSTRYNITVTFQDGGVVSAAEVMLFLRNHELNGVICMCGWNSEEGSTPIYEQWLGHVNALLHSKDGATFNGSVYGEDAFDALQNFADEQDDLLTRLESGEEYVVKSRKEP